MLGLRLGHMLGLSAAAAAVRRLQFLFNGLNTSSATFTGGGQIVADYQGTLQSVPSGIPAIEGARLATTVADGAELGPEIFTGLNAKAGMTNNGDGSFSFDGTQSNGWLTDTANPFIVGTVYYRTFTVSGYVSGNYIPVGGTVIANGASSSTTHAATDVNDVVYVYNGFIGTIKFSVREVIPTWKSTDTNGDSIYSQETVATANGSVVQFTEADPSTFPGYLGEGARTNKVTARKANPVDTSNLTKAGDAAATLTVVDDSAALAAAGLDDICTSGNVYKLDNTAGTGLAWVNFGGNTGNTNNHSISIEAKGIGSIAITGQYFTQRTDFNNAGYSRVTLNDATVPSTTTMAGFVDAGDTAYFILPQLEEAAFASSPIVDPDNDTLTSVTRSATVLSFPSEDYIRSQNCAVMGTVIPSAGGQANLVAMFSSYVDGSNMTEVFIYSSTVRFRKIISGTLLEANSSYSHVGDRPLQYQAYWSTKGVGIRVREYSGGWGAWSSWATNANTDEAQIASTFQIGSRNGADHLFANYPSTKTAYIPTLNSAAEVQAYLDREDVWQEVV